MNIPLTISYHFPSCCCECTLLMFTPIINISNSYWIPNCGNSCCLGHETGIHWITTHMTMKAPTIGCDYHIKQLYTVTLRDPFRGTLEDNLWLETL